MQDDEFAKQLADALDIVLGRPGIALVAVRNCELINKLRDEMIRLEQKTEAPVKNKRQTKKE